MSAAGNKAFSILRGGGSASDKAAFSGAIAATTDGAVDLPYSWETIGAAIDIDFVRDRAAWLGLKFSSIDNFVKAIGGTRSGQKITFPWTDNSATIIVEAQIAQQPAGDEYLYSIDDGTNANTHRMRRDNAGGAPGGLRAQTIATSATIADMPGGALYRGDFVRTAHSVSASAFRFARNAVASAAANPGSPSLPPVTTVRIGTGAAGGDWTGVINRVIIYSTPELDLPTVAALATPAWDAVSGGDSYVAGSGGVGLAASAAKLRQKFYNPSLGGSSLLQQRDVLVALPDAYKNLPLIFWDGDANGFGVLGTDMGYYADIVAAFPHGRILIIPPARRSGQSGAQQSATTALTAALKAAYPGRVLDVMPLLLSLGDPVADSADIAANFVPASLLQDGIHLKSAPIDAVAAVALDVMRSRGWIAKP